MKDDPTSVTGLDFPSNSRFTKGNDSDDHRPHKKDESKKVIAQTVFREESKPLVVRLFGEDSAIREIGRYLLWDVAVPAAKDVIVDGLGDAINMLIYGEESNGRSRRRRTGLRSNDRSYVSYNSYYRGDERERRSSSRSDERQSRSRRYSFREVIFSSRDEAQDVLEYLSDRITEFGHATVADFFEATGQPSIFTDNNWGWYSLKSAEIRRGRDGIFIEMPKPEPLDD